MRRGGGKVEALFALGRRRSFQTLFAVGVVYLVLVTFELPFVFSGPGAGAGGGASEKLVAAESLPRGMLLETKGDRELKEAPVRPGEVLSFAPERSAGQPSSHSPAGGFPIVSSLNFSAAGAGGGGSGDGMDKAVKEAWEVGTKFWADLESGAAAREVELKKASRKKSEESCPHSISLTGAQFTEKGRLMVLPCGLTLGSHITLVGKPYRAHAEPDPKISILKDGSQSTMVSQFRMELQGLKTVDGEDPPRILHFNPRLTGDWSGKPVIELNTCYRMQWGTPQRCEGWISKADEETGMPLF